MSAIERVIAVAIWVGHACLWTTLLNVVYSQAWPKRILKPWRLFTGAVIGLFPLALIFGPRAAADATPIALDVYYSACAIVGAAVLPVITLCRHLRTRPPCVLEERTATLDLGVQLGEPARGDGKWRWLTYLPWNGVFKLDVTELTLKPPRLPAALDGLSILLLSDLHFHGTPSERWFDAVVDRLMRFPKPDVVALAGDYLDSDAHGGWLGAVLGRLEWSGVGVAILGNHDAHHRPERTRAELARLGFAVLGGPSLDTAIRGERVVFTGHEGPWFPGPAPVPAGGFRVCVSHSPDQFRWARRRGFDLVLCGHVHGGQIRLPIVGSIFVPSRYGRRYDMGVFEKDGTAMVVGRGLSGKEPLRWGCNPQVIRVVLRR